MGSEGMTNNQDLPGSEPAAADGMLRMAEGVN